MPRSRPEFDETIEFLALPECRNDPVAFLARTGGAKVTDNFEIFSYPELDEKGDYNLCFFAQGLRYLPEGSLERIKQMSKGDKVLLAHDFQNPFEEGALQLHTRDNYIVGCCPSYLLDDLNDVRKKRDLEVCVERVNDDAPPQFRLLCRLIVSSANGYKPFTSQCYSPVVSSVETLYEREPAFAS
jgi:hypothetical protein